MNYHTILHDIFPHEKKRRKYMRFQHTAEQFYRPADLFYNVLGESGYPQMVVIGVLQLL